MKSLQRLGALTILSSTILFTQSALAYTQFTYKSSELPFVQGYLGGLPDENVGSTDYTYGFSATFDATESNRTNFISGTFAGLPPLSGKVHNISLIDSSITLNTDDSVSAWNFSFSVLSEDDGDVDSGIEPTHETWLINSSYGANTCNCDYIKAESDIFIQRQNGWQYINTLGFEFEGANSPGNWTIENVDVPEPFSYLLLLSGLGLIGTSRLRKIS